MKKLALTLTLLLTTVICSAAEKDPDNTLAEAAAFNATLYGYPMVALYNLFQTRLEQSNTLGRTGFDHDRQLADAENKAIPAPNNDTLYSRGFFDLSLGPVMLKIPPIANRFYAFPIGDAFHNIVTTFGSWNTGHEGASILLVGPDWEGPLADADETVQMPTNFGWILARVLVSSDKADLEQVRRLQDQFHFERVDGAGRLVDAPLYGAADHYPPAGNIRDPESYFATLNYMLSFNPFPSRDQGLVATFGPIHVGPGEHFDNNGGDRSALVSGFEAGMAYMEKHSNDLGEKVNGWSSVALEADMGTRYYYRAVINYIGLLHGDDSMQAAYTVFVDGDGKKLDGKQRYVIHFDSAPPVQAFWSLTMYGEDFFLVKNPIQRYSIGDRTPGLQLNSDGSLDIYLQHDRPAADKQANWLPTPEGPFWMGLRAYLPTPEFLHREWLPAPVTHLP